ncbi:hypothetical protein ACFU8Q_35675 [Streptomyces sp. NPDC057543]
MTARLTDHFDGGGRTPDPEDLVCFIRADREAWSAGADDDRAVLALALT